jgi:hypothetical protein
MVRKNIFIFVLGLILLAFSSLCGKTAEAALTYETIGNGGYNLGNITVTADGRIWAVSGDRVVCYNPANGSWSATPSVGFNINLGIYAEGNYVWVGYGHDSSGLAKVARWNGSSWWVLTPPSQVDGRTIRWDEMAASSWGVALIGPQVSGYQTYGVAATTFVFSSGYWNSDYLEYFDYTIDVAVAASPTEQAFYFNAIEGWEEDGPDYHYFHQWKFNGYYSELVDTRNDNIVETILVSTPNGLYSGYLSYYYGYYLGVGSSTIWNAGGKDFLPVGVSLENNKVYARVKNGEEYRLYSFKLDANLVEYIGNFPSEPAGAATDANGNVWFTCGGTLYRAKPVTATPAPNGMTGQLPIKPLIFGYSPSADMTLEVSWNGSNFYTLGNINSSNPILTVVPQSSNCNIRLKRSWSWISQGSNTIVTTQAVSNTYTIPCIYGSPAVTLSTGVKQWSQTRGYSWLTLSWPSMANISGYKLHVFDGNTYRTKDLGNVNSWDSRTAKIFPFPGELPENNSVSSDIFRWDGSGLDFEDTALRLYRSTVGTGYDNDPKFYFRVTAYNQWMETDFNASSSFKAVTMPVATDAQQPAGSASAVSTEGLEKTFNPDIKVSVNASDSGSGIWKVELSNDGVSYTQKYVATKNADGGTGVASYSNTFDWTVPLGAGTKVVYVRITDAVGNQKVVTDTIALSEDMLPPSISLLINGGAASTTNKNVTLTISVSDNASVSSQMQMSFSNDGNLWSPWEPYQQTKTWDITNSSYGGTTGAGVKKVYVRIYDQAQNIGLTSAEIAYNPNPPVASGVTFTGGVSGTYSGQPAIFVKGDMPILNVTATGAAKMRYDNGIGVWSDWEPYVSSKQIVLAKSSGVCRVRVQVADSYGVASEPVETLVVVDGKAPVITGLRTLSGATATSGSSIQLLVEAGDDLSSTLSYNVNGGGYSVLPSNGVVTVPVSNPGPNTLLIGVKDQAGNIATKAITIWKL